MTCLHLNPAPVERCSKEVILLFYNVLTGGKGIGTFTTWCDLITQLLKVNINTLCSQLTQCSQWLSCWINRPRGNSIKDKSGVKGKLLFYFLENLNHWPYHDLKQRVGERVLCRWPRTYIVTMYAVSHKVITLYFCTKKLFWDRSI